METKGVGDGVALVPGPVGLAVGGVRSDSNGVLR